MRFKIFNAQLRPGPLTLPDPPWTLSVPFPPLGVNADGDHVSCGVPVCLSAFASTSCAV